MNERLARLEALVGVWQGEAVVDGRTMSSARTTTDWIGDGRLLAQHTAAADSLAPEWEGLSPLPSDVVIGVDDHSGAFTALYGDARGVCRVYAMTFEDGLWRMSSRPGPDFHQRFAARVADDRIDGRWERSEDGERWALDFELVSTRIG